MWRGLTGRDCIAGFVAIAIAAIYLTFAYDIRRSALSDAVGPGGVPRLLGWAMMTLGTVLVMQGLLKAQRSVPRDIEITRETAGEWSGQGRKLARAGGMLLIAVSYIILVGWLGYALSIALAIASVALFLGAAPSWRTAVIAIVGALALWVIFDLLLGVPMPVGSMFDWPDEGR